MNNDLNMIQSVKRNCSAERVPRFRRKTARSQPSHTLAFAAGLSMQRGTCVYLATFNPVIQRNRLSRTRRKTGQPELSPIKWRNCPTEKANPTNDSAFEQHFVENKSTNKSEDHQIPIRRPSATHLHGQVDTCEIKARHRQKSQS